MKKNRLYGTLRSDICITLRYIHCYHQLRGKKKRKLASIFGKLTVKYTPQFVHIRLQGEVRKERYTIVAEDRSSTIIRVSNDQLRKKMGPVWADCFDDFKPTLSQLKFDKIGKKTCYWVLAGRFCECFAKIT